MNRRRGGKLPSRYLLFFLTMICMIFLFAGYALGYDGQPFRTITNYIFVPMQNGIDYIGDVISVNNADTKTRAELISENEQLKSQVEELTSQISNIRLEQSELTDLRELYNVDNSYENYETVGAKVISKGTSNWFNTFTINKGSADGIETDMNVIASGGLVGIVTDVAPNYSTVMAIVDDTSRVSAMTLTGNNNCIVSGNLTTMTESGMITISNLEDKDGAVPVGDPVVTSNISSKYLPGLLIGYITTIEDDSNNLTKSGEITPVVDFNHLNNVLVITTVKDTGEAQLAEASGN